MTMMMKYDVSSSTHYEDRKGDAKYGKMGWFEVVRDLSTSLEIAQHHLIECI